MVTAMHHRRRVRAPGAAALLLVVLVSVGGLWGVGAQESLNVHCNLRGMMNATSQKCMCVSGWTGPDCSQQLCAVGYAWADYVTGDNKAHRKWTECSSMGYCDRSTGKCACRDGFEGAGCQYLACPKNGAGKTCSDHGKCLTVREAASKWDGRALVRPGVRYDNWDADQIQGCVCDEGFSGYDCSAKACPRGDDPLTTGQKNEVVQVACRADSGYWFLSFGGATSRPIPYNAGYGTIERLLEAMHSVRGQPCRTHGAIIF